MGHQEIVLRHYRLVRVILCFVVLDVITILVLWEREGTSTALERELELGLRLFHLRGHVTHFGRYLRWQVWRRWDVTLLYQELLLFVLHILDVSHYAKAFHICSEIQPINTTHYVARRRSPDFKFLAFWSLLVYHLFDKICCKSRPIFIGRRGWLSNFCIFKY